MTTFDRRQVLTAGAAAAGLSGLGTQTHARVPAGRDPFEYEFTLTDAEWRERLGDAYSVLREGKTERQRSSPIWDETRAGMYHCKGCDLPHYHSDLKVQLPKGWLFFVASEPNSQLMSIDSIAVMAERPTAHDARIEVHCRRCGSHIGHILLVGGEVLHCINGASLNFIEAQA